MFEIQGCFYFCEVSAFFIPASEGFFELKEKGSRFLAYSYAVSDEPEIREYLHALQEQYPDATHHCYAWVLRDHPSGERANDDGEPSNSAGRPILRQIYSAGVCNCLVVVVRYFGGTQLGVPGLIQAYGQAAKGALTVSGQQEVWPEKKKVLEFDFQDEGIAFRLLKQMNARILEIEKLHRGRIRFAIREQELTHLEGLMKTHYTLELKDETDD